MSIERTCQRCGIDTAEMVGIICNDCAEVTSGDTAHRWNHSGPQWPEVAASIDEAIRRYNSLGRPDTQIAALLGISSRTVLRRRIKLGIPGIKTPGMDFWTPESAARYRSPFGARMAEARRRKRQQAA